VATSINAMEEELIRFACRNCRYAFRRRANWDEYVCPYCGQKQVEREDTINKIIHDVE